MGDGGYRTDLFADQAGQRAGTVHGDGIERADEPRLQGADGNTGAATDAGIPVDIEQYGLWFQSPVILKFYDTQTAD